MLFPMYTVPAGILLQMTRIESHEELKAKRQFWARCSTQESKVGGHVRYVCIYIYTYTYMYHVCI